MDELRDGLDSVVRDSLVPVCCLLGALYAVLSVGHAVWLPPAAARVLTPMAALSSVLLLLACARLRQRLPTPRHAPAWAFAIACVVLANCLTHFAVTGETRQTTNLILLLLGSGFLITSTAWFGAVAALVTLGWGTILWSLPSPTAPRHYAFALGQALLLAALVHALRLRMLRRLIAERRLLDAELVRRRRAEERSRALVGAVPDVVFRVDRQGRVLDVAGASPDDLLLPPEQILGRRLADLPLPEDVRSRSLEAIERALETGQDQSLDYDLVVGGEPRSYDGRLTPCGEDEVVMVSRNVSRERSAERALRASEQRFRELFENNPALLCTHDLNGKLLAINPAAARALGYPPEAAATAPGRLFQEFMAAPHAGGFEAYMAEIGERGVAEGIVGMRTAAGEQRRWRYRNVLRREPGQEPRVIGFALDVTEELRAHEAQADSERRYRELFASIPLPAWVFDADTLRFLAVNDAAVAHYGYTREQFLGMRLVDVNAPEHRADVLAIPSADAASSDRTGVWNHVRSDGSRIEVEVATHALEFDGRRARCAVVEDVTQRRRVQQFKDELVAIAAHELRNPLTGIHGALSALCEAESLSASERELARIAFRNSERMRRLIDDLLDLEKAESGQLELGREPIDVAGLVGEAVHANEAYARGFQVGLVLGELPAAATVIGDRDRLGQVLTNLLGNAAKFSPGGSVVEVGARLVDGDRVRIEVSDRGPGVPEGFRARIFQRFARSREHAGRVRGSGLGLAISRAIVEELGGRIGFEERSGGGTTFWLALPLAADSAAG